MGIRLDFSWSHRSSPQQQQQYRYLCSYGGSICNCLLVSTIHTKKIRKLFVFDQCFSDYGLYTRGIVLGFVVPPATRPPPRFIAVNFSSKLCVHLAAGEKRAGRGGRRSRPFMRHRGSYLSHGY